MTTRVTEGTRRERLPPSVLASRGLSAQRSPARASPLLNLKKKRDCLQSNAHRLVLLLLLSLCVSSFPSMLSHVCRLTQQWNGKKKKKSEPDHILFRLVKSVAFYRHPR